MKSPYRHGRGNQASGAGERSGEAAAPPRKDFAPRKDSASRKDEREPASTPKGAGFQKNPNFKSKPSGRNFSAQKPRAEGWVPEDALHHEAPRFTDVRSQDPRTKDKSRFAPKPKKEKYQAPEDCDVLYGIHTVREALTNPLRKHRRLLVTENAFVRLSEDINLPLAPDVVKPEMINQLLPPDAVHQGVYLEAERLPLLRLEKLPQDKVIVALDQVTDPHNVGAILRSSAAFDVGAILTTFRNSPDITGVLAKAASGALEHVPLVGVTNLGRALTELRDEGYQIIGLDSEAPEPMHTLVLRLPVVLVLGAEGKGLRQSTRTLCDHLARIELPGTIKSLNVSNAAAVSLYAVRQALTAK